jgi:hypothetical protein
MVSIPVDGRFIRAPSDEDLVQDDGRMIKVAKKIRRIASKSWEAND